MRPAARLGAQDDEFVQLVQRGALPPVALAVRLLHDQLRINLPRQKEPSGSAAGLRWTRGRMDDTPDVRNVLLQLPAASTASPSSR